MAAEPSRTGADLISTLLHQLGELLDCETGNFASLIARYFFVQEAPLDEDDFFQDLLAVWEWRQASLSAPSAISHAPPLTDAEIFLAAGTRGGVFVYPPHNYLEYMGIRAAAGRPWAAGRAKRSRKLALAGADAYIDLDAHAGS